MNHEPLALGQDPNQPESPHDLHGVEPSRIFEAVALAFLVVGFLVDLVAFNSALGLLSRQMTDIMTWTISVGAGLMALYLMVEAGRLEAKRRERFWGNRTGRSPIRAMIAIWLLAGLVASFIRLSVPPSSSTSTTPTFGRVEPSASAPARPGKPAPKNPFDKTAGSASSNQGQTSSAESFKVGPITLHMEELPIALFMFALYLGVGMGAFQYGKHSYRPLLTALRRARRDERKSRRKLRRLERKRDRALAKASTLSAVSGEIDRDRASLAALQRAQRLLNSYAETQARHEAGLTQQTAWTQREGILSQQIADLEELGTRTKAHARSLETGAREIARHRLHQGLNSPERTVLDDDYPAL